MYTSKYSLSLNHQVLDSDEVFVSIIHTYTVGCFCFSGGLIFISQLAKALRKGPFQTQLLMGGVDKRTEGKDDASLFWLDYLGTMQKVLG